MMTKGDPEGRIFLSYPQTNHRFFFLAYNWFIYLFIFFQKKLEEVTEYAKMQFHMMTLLDIPGKIAWVKYDLLSQGKISDILIPCARKVHTSLRLSSLINA